MQASKMSSTIHVNPMFKENSKSVIHINPNVNMAIHVNPRMVNAMAHGTMQRRIEKNPFISKKETCAPKVQKSVYVNPILMQKLAHKTPDVEIIERPLNDERVNFQPKIQTFDPAINTRVHHTFVKNASPNLVSLSRRKLVRIRPENEPQNSGKIVPNCGNILSQISPRTVQIRKIMRGHRLKKVNCTNELKKLNVISVGNQRKSASPLKKINSNVLGLKGGNRVKVSPKSSAPSNKTSGNKYKIDRTVADKRVKASVTRKPLGSNCKNLVNIDGVFYRSSKSHLVRSASTSAPKTPKKSSTPSPRSKKHSTHIVINGKIAKINTSNLRITSPPSLGQKSNYKHVLSNRVKQRSLQILRHKMCKNNQPCLLFQRFGYCAKHVAGTCPKVHDKKQVALCKNFLQGKCLLDNCPLSHDVGPEKMPTCKYFLEGCCTRDNCQYLHVKVSANTPICVPFLRGYCAKGDQCKERHTNICPEFDKYGKCEKGKNCSYPHKTCLLTQHNRVRLPRALNSYEPSKFGNKTVDISVRDDSKKRYYDESCSGQNFEDKRCNINKQIRAMTMVYRAMEGPDVEIITDEEINSQPITEEVRPRRPPIGPLPSYIPIN